MLEELKTFIAVVEIKNFTKAAEYLSLSQPSVSVHIKNLENYFGEKLIDRSVRQKSIKITEQGYLLYKRAKEVVSIIDAAKLEVKIDTEQVSGDFKISAVPSAANYILPKYIANFSKKYPNINIELSIKAFDDVKKDLVNLNADVGIIDRKIMSDDFEQQECFKESMKLIFPYDYKSYISNIHSYDNLSGKNWILREKGSGTRFLTEYFLNKKQIIPKSVFIMGSSYSVKEAVKNGMGISILSSSACKQFENSNEILCMDIDNEFSRTFYSISQKNFKPKRSVSLFLDEIKNSDAQN